MGELTGKTQAEARPQQQQTQKAKGQQQKAAAAAAAPVEPQTGGERSVENGLYQHSVPFRRPDGSVEDKSVGWMRDNGFADQVSAGDMERARAEDWRIFGGAADGPGGGGVEKPAEGVDALFSMLGLSECAHLSAGRGEGGVASPPPAPAFALSSHAYGAAAGGDGGGGEAKKSACEHEGIGEDPAGEEERSSSDGSDAAFDDAVYDVSHWHDLNAWRRAMVGKVRPLQRPKRWDGDLGDAVVALERSYWDYSQAKQVEEVLDFPLITE